MIEKWKITRELKRLKQQLSMLPEILYEPFARRIHDRAFDRGFPEHVGLVDVKPKVAMILIWQPKGISLSTIHTFKHFLEKGYSILAISNSTISNNDLELIRPYVWRVLERPNFGYDFGGYRDGLKYLKNKDICPDFLVILNDSILYPVLTNDTTLEEMEASKSDITGIIMRSRREVCHLESYFYMINGHVLKSKAFKFYWKNYRLTSNKYKVIRRGERGFSTSMQAAGLTVSALFSEQVFIKIVMAADEDLLRKSIKYSAFPSIKKTREAAALVTIGTKADFKQFIESSLEKSQFYSAFPIISYNKMRFPVLKRSSDETAVALRHAVGRAARDGELDFPFAAIVEDAGMRQNLPAK